MYTGGSKFQKTQKTKFKKNEDKEFGAKDKTKPKHHDKSFYRLKKQEDKEYEY